MYGTFLGSLFQLMKHRINTLHVAFIYLFSIASRGFKSECVSVCVLQLCAECAGRETNAVCSKPQGQTTQQRYFISTKALSLSPSLFPPCLSLSRYLSPFSAFPFLAISLFLFLLPSFTLFPLSLTLLATARWLKNTPGPK